MIGALSCSEIREPKLKASPTVSEAESFAYWLTQVCRIRM